MIDASTEDTGPQYVTDAAGNRVAVLLELERYHELLEAWEELDDIRAYDAAKSSGEEAVSLEQALRGIGRGSQSP